MNAALVSLSHSIDLQYREIQRLQLLSLSSGSSVLVELDSDQQDKSRLTLLQQEYHRGRQMLREINEYFHHYFVSHIFNSLNEDVNRSSIDLGLLELNLQRVRAHMTSVVDPILSLNVKRQQQQQSHLPALSLPPPLDTSNDHELVHIDQLLVSAVI